MMVQAADRRQPGAIFIPPALPAPDWRRDSSEIPITWLQAPPLCAEPAERPRLRPPDRPAAVMVLAPVLGAVVWVGILAMVL